MAATILNEKQQKRTLGKKKSNKQTVKNVLSTSEAYWPLLKEDDIKSTKAALEKYLPKVRCEKIPIKYDDIKKLSKEERKVYRQSLYKDINISEESEHIAFGINHVNRLVSNKQIVFVLIANDVMPRLMLEGVIQECLINKTPLLVVPDLRKLLKKHCGISSMIVAIKNEVKTDMKLFLLNNILSEIYKRYTPSDTSVANEDVIEGNLDLQKSKQEETLQLKEPIKLEDIYLTRENKFTRVFQPEKHHTKKEENICTDFISFSESVYKPLVVKRIKNDPNRNIKKLKKVK